LNSVSYFIVGLMDGTRTIQEIWNSALEGLGDDVPTQDEVIRLFGDLHGADILQCDVSPEAAELQQRYRKSRRRAWMQRLLNPMALRFPLVDPDRFLSATLPAVGWLFSRWGALAWLVIVGMAAVQAGVHWQELTRNITDQALAPGNILLLLVIFPLVKALHELGHGYAVRRWGGEVHDMGVMLLVLMPVPYVDATASWEFREKSQRMVVGAAGMLVELLLAALAMFAWLAVEPGLLRAVLFNIMLIAGVSTVVFNANPLLRFDGYYIFADWLEIPNLAPRATRYLAYLTQRHVFGARDAQPVNVQPDERVWLACYAVASFVYRLFVAAAIVVFIAGRFFAVGIVLAIWVAGTMLVLPLVKGIKFLLHNPVLRTVRGRSWAVSGGAVAGAIALIFVIPVPFMTRAQGVAWLPEQAQVRAGTGGFVAEVVATPATDVQQGNLLIRLADPTLVAELAVARARKDELNVRYRAELTTNRVDAEITREELAALDRELARLEERVASLEIRAATSGRFVVPKPQDLPERYVAQGETVGWVIGQQTPRVRVVTTQADVDLIRAGTREVLVRRVSDLATEHAARVLREVPAASNELPSAALSRQGGGELANDPSARQTSIAFETVFQFELELPTAAVSERFGERVYVRFHHGYAPLWSQWYRKLKILLLRLLDD
jgi:putative peptide zinc metalloprotease protein